MKEYELRENVDTIDICLCGHSNGSHEMRFREFLMMWNMDYTGKCNICTCPKYNKEKTILKKDHLKSKEIKD